MTGGPIRLHRTAADQETPAAVTACRTALLCLLLALLAPAGAGAAENAVREPTLLAPQLGELIAGPFVVHVVTPPDTDNLELRVLRTGTVLTGPDDVMDSTVTGGERHWHKQLDLSSLPNGLVTVQVRPSATPGADTTWTGVMVLLSTPPATPTESVVPEPDDGPLEAPSDGVTVPVEPAPAHEPADESREATPEPGDTRVRATGGSEPRQVEEPVPAETESAPRTPRERNAAMRPTASSQEVGTSGSQVDAPQVAPPETAPPERSSPPRALARPPAATLTISHPDRLVTEQGSLASLLALLLAGLLLARHTRRSARR